MSTAHHPTDAQHSGGKPRQAPPRQSVPAGPEHSQPGRSQPGRPPLTGAQLGAAAGVGALAYLAALITGIACVLVLGAAANTDQAGDVLQGAEPLVQDARGLGDTLSLLFQIVPLAFFGRFTVSIQAIGQSLPGGVAFGIAVVPVTVTVVTLLVAALLARLLLARRRPAGWSGTVAAAAVAGLVFTVLMTVLAGALALRVAEAGIAARATSAGFWAAVAALLLVGAAVAVAARPTAVERGAGPRVVTVGRATVSEVRHGLGLMLVHGVVLTVLLGLLWVLVVLIELQDPALLLAAPAIGPHAIGYLLAAAHGAPLTMTAPVGLGFTAQPQTQTIDLFEMGPSWMGISALVISILVTVLMGLRWQLTRERLPYSAGTFGWFVLPVLYLAGSALLLWVLHLSLGGQLLGETLQSSLGITGWFVLVAAWVGVVIEVLARLVAPLLTARAPGLRRVLLAGSFPVRRPEG